MAHAVAQHGLSGSARSHGNRRSKQHDRNFEAVFGRSGSHPAGPQRSYYCGIPMGACGGGLSVSSSTHGASDRNPRESGSTVTCTRLLGLRVASVVAAVGGVSLIFFGLFLIPGSKILGLCIPGGLLVTAALLIWCALYVHHGKCCSKRSDSASLGGTPEEGATQRAARGSTSGDAPTSPDIMTSFGPDTKVDRQHSYSPPPKYHAMGRCASFPTSGRGMGQPPSTPPPPYYEIT